MILPSSLDLLDSLAVYFRNDMKQFHLGLSKEAESNSQGEIYFQAYYVKVMPCCFNLTLEIIGIMSLFFISGNES